MKEAAVVVLNYLNYLETEECINSVLLQKKCNFRVIIVDNGSDNESYKYLLKKYRSTEMITVIRSRKNYGFAKGNNMGIHYARKFFKTDYVLLLNSDTILTDPYYLYKMLSADRKGVGVIGSRIVLKNGIIQKYFKRIVVFPGTMYYYLYLFFEYRGFKKVAEFFRIKASQTGSKDILQGCALLITPAFFNSYDGLDTRTFLYCEEELLYLRCKKAGLIQIKTDETSLFHKVGQSAKLFYGNKSSLYDHYILSSCKYVVLESFQLFIREKRK